MTNTINCRGCSDVVTGNYCANCGLPVKLKRVDSHYISHEIQHVLHLEKGFLYTIKELLVRPGQNVKEFLADNRNRMVKPVIFIILTSLIYTTAVHFFHIEDKYIQYKSDKVSAINAVFGWIQSHYGYANLIIGVFIALWLKVFFRRYPYNFFEILILLCFVMGVGMLIAAIFAPVQALLNVEIMQIGSMVGVVYCTWAIGQFFDRKKTASYFKALFAYLLGMITAMLLALMIGVAIDLLIKH